MKEGRAVHGTYFIGVWSGRGYGFGFFSLSLFPFLLTNPTFQHILLTLDRGLREEGFAPSSGSSTWPTLSSFTFV